MSTKVLPTDKHGNVYYGPRTFAQAEAKIDEVATHPEMTMVAAARGVYDELYDAGFVRVAGRVDREYLTAVDELGRLAAKLGVIVGEIRENRNGTITICGVDGSDTTLADEMAARRYLRECAE